MPNSDVDAVVKSEVLELQVVPYMGGNRNGRPLFLTARRFIGICKLIEQGASSTEACRRALVSYAGFRGHVARQPLYQKRLKKAEAIRDQVWRSDALDAVHSAFTKNWVSAMTFLERRYPTEFALRAVNRPADADAGKPAEDLPAEKLAHFRALQLELAREDEAKAAAKTLPESPAGDSEAVG
jgi:hypothetical protein